MRSRSASAAATRRRAIRGRAARETRARKRTLSSRPEPPPGPLAPFVAGAPWAARPPRESLPLALTVACSERPSERTDLALSTSLASRRSTWTSSESWPKPQRGSLKPMLVWIATDSTPTSASAVRTHRSCRAGCGRARPRCFAGRLSRGWPRQSVRLCRSVTCVALGGAGLFGGTERPGAPGNVVLASATQGSLSST